LATITATIAYDPWEAENMLVRLAGQDVNADDVAALRARINVAKNAATHQQRAARLATIGANVAQDPREAERMLARFAGQDGNTDDVAALRAIINGAKRKRAGETLHEIHQACFEKIGATFNADLRRHDTEHVIASIQIVSTRGNFLKAVSLIKMADAQINSLPIVDLDPLQKSDLSGLKAGTASSLGAIHEVLVKMNRKAPY
jgi:hypothetical protein